MIQDMSDENLLIQWQEAQQQKSFALHLGLTSRKPTMKKALVRRAIGYRKTEARFFAEIQRRMSS